MATIWHLLHTNILLSLLSYFSWYEDGLCRSCQDGSPNSPCGHNSQHICKLTLGFGPQNRIKTVKLWPNTHSNGAWSPGQKTGSLQNWKPGLLTLFIESFLCKVLQWCSEHLPTWAAQCRGWDCNSLRPTHLEGRSQASNYVLSAATCSSCCYTRPTLQRQRDRENQPLPVGPASRVSIWKSSSGGPHDWLSALLPLSWNS